MSKLPKNLHLALSAVVIVGVALVYGSAPGTILPLVFDFQVESVELKNIFRALMGLYLGFALYWIVGIVKPDYWRSATMSNVLFMGGLAFGRIISSFLDGYSNQFVIALFLELALMLWGIVNLKRSS